MLLRNYQPYTEDAYLLEHDSFSAERNEDMPLWKKANKHYFSHAYHFFIHWLANDLLFINALTHRFPTLQRVSDFSDGISFVTHKLWSPVFLGLFLHDLIHFAAFPNDRYDVNLSQILMGTADNQFSFSSHLGSDLPQNWKYSLGVGLTVAAVLSGGVLQMMCARKKRMRLRFPLLSANELDSDEGNHTFPETFEHLYTEQPDFADRLLNRFPSWIERPISYYRNWAALKPVSWYWHPPFWAVVLFSLYADARLVELWINKIQGLKKYFEDKAECGENKIFSFMPEYGNNECTVCDWDFVEPRDRFDVEKCFNGLLSSNQLPAFILENIERLLKQSSFTTLDFSRQSWLQWTEKEWENFLSRLLHSPHDWQTVNLSSTVFNPVISSSNRVKLLANFIEKTNVTKLDLHNQKIGDTAIESLSDVISQLHHLDISSNQLTKVGFLLNATHQLDTLNIENNKLGDQEAKKLFDTLTENNLSQLDVSNTHISEEALNILSDVLPQSQLKIIDLSENNLSQANLSALGEAILQSQIEEIHLSQTQIIDEEAAGFVSVAVKKLKHINLSKNKLSDPVAKAVVSSSINGTLTSVDLSGNDISDEGVRDMAVLLQTNQTHIFEVNLAHTQMTADGFASIVEVPQLITLDVSNNAIGDDAAAILNQKRFDISVEKLNLSSTQLTDKGGEQLAEAMQDLNMTVLDISKNKVTDDSFKKIVQAHSSSLKNLNAADNQITDEGAKALALALPENKLEIVRLETNFLTESSGAVIAKSLIKPPTPHLDKIGNDHIDVDEARALRNRQIVPATKIRSIFLDQNLFQAGARRAFRRILPSIPDVHIYIVQKQMNTLFSMKRAPLLGNGSLPQPNVNTVPCLALSLVTGMGTIIIGFIAIYLIYHAIKNMFSTEKNQTQKGIHLS